MKPSLYPNEKILKEGRATRYLAGPFRSSYARGKLVVTSHRLIFKNLFQEIAYPLARIIHVSKQRYLLFPVVHLDFDNGGVEQFSVSNPAEWIRIIEQAKANAPLLPDATLPSPSAPPKISGLLIASALGLIVLCSCLMVTLIVVLFLPLR